MSQVAHPRRDFEEHGRGRGAEKRRGYGATQGGAAGGATEAA